MTQPSTPDAASATPAENPQAGGTWAIDDAAAMYHLASWGKDYFAIDDRGHVNIVTDPKAGHRIDLHEVVTGLTERGIEAPVLICFTDLLARRLTEMNGAFARAMDEHNYRGKYNPVFPIKVNQHRYLVEQVKAGDNGVHVGLEAGSKPELLAVLGMTAGEPDRLIICNGFKEERYIRHVMLAHKLGRKIIPVIENLSELRLIIQQAEAFGVRPRIGVRVNLSVRGVGRWKTSSGEKAKFGLSVPAVLNVVEVLREHDMLDCLQLVHCHIGSQTNDIRVVNHAVTELVRIYTQLTALGANMQYLDIGGGMGIDYDGSQGATEYSVNYTLDEYAANVVYRVMSVCDEAKIEHPTIVTESGRAMVSHQGVLVFNVLGVNRTDRFAIDDQIDNLSSNNGELPRPIGDLIHTYKHLKPSRLLEAYHDAMQARDEALTLFNVGFLSLEHRGLMDRLFWSLCLRIRKHADTMENVPDELAELDLSDTYFCNLSIFQSMPDSWAIDQVFPIMPIHRLDEEPTRDATLADLTCDSDGKITHFVGGYATSHSIKLHELNEDEPYYLAAFLVGAYQETLGDLHNLFGDTHLVHITFDKDEKQWVIDHVVEGDSVREVLGYLQYDVNELYQAIRRDCDRSVRSGTLTVKESRTLLEAYQYGLSGYTYLE